MNKPYADSKSNMKNLGFPFNKIDEPVTTNKTEITFNSLISKEKLLGTIDLLDKKIRFFEKRYGINSSELHSNYNKITSIKVKGCNGFDDYHEWSSLLLTRDRISNKIK